MVAWGESGLQQWEDDMEVSKMDKVVCKEPPSVVLSFSVLKPCENKFEGRIDMLNVFRS